jgi:xylulokinase
MIYYLTYDLGTTALKTALIDEDGHVAGAFSSEYTPHMPTPERSEMPADVYWQALVTGTRQVLTASGVDRSAVKAIGFSSQGQTFVPIDRAGQPLYNFMTWLDNRARDIAERWSSSWLTPAAFQAISGYPWIPPGLTVFKIAWLRENAPTAHAAWKFLCLPDYMIYRLTGETVTDTVTARMAGLYSLSSAAWEPKLLAAAGICADQLPRLLPSGAVAGHLHAAAASELGLPGGIPVVTGANDQLVGAVGAGNVAPGIVTETTGTALAVVSSTETLLNDSRLTVGTHAAPGIFYAMAFANTSAILLSWFREVCDKSGQDFTAFLAGAAAVPPGCDGLTILPHFMGATPPIGDPMARGAILGLSLAHTRDHLVRGFMEACACLLMECMEPFIEQGVSVHSVRSLGKPAQNDTWLQMKADLLNLPMERPAGKDPTSRGAAMLAAAATGQFHSLDEAVQAWYHPAAVFEPIPANRAVYQDVYARYRSYSKKVYS